MRILALFAAALLSASALAADKPCSKADASNAQKALDRAATWAQMHKTWQEYRHCEAQPTGDQFTDALMRLIIDWKNVDAFAGTMQKDAQFKEFVFTHLKSPAAKDDLDDVYSRAKSKCPNGLDAFCSELADAARPKK